MDKKQALLNFIESFNSDPEDCRKIAKEWAFGATLFAYKADMINREEMDEIIRLYHLAD